MKKNFSLTSSNHRPDRQIEMVKGEINKYIARERRKAFPPGVDYWDFDCKCGAAADSAVTVRVGDIGKAIDDVFATKSDNVYVEVLAKPGVRKKNLT